MEHDGRLVRLHGEGPETQAGELRQRPGQPLLERGEQAGLRIGRFVVGHHVQQVRKRNAVLVSQQSGDPGHPVGGRLEAEEGRLSSPVRLLSRHLSQALGEPPAALYVHLLGKYGDGGLVARSNDARQHPHLVERKATRGQGFPHVRQLRQLAGNPGNPVTFGRSEAEPLGQPGAHRQAAVPAVGFACLVSCGQLEPEGA